MFFKSLLRPLITLKEATQVMFVSRIPPLKLGVPVTSVEFYQRPLPRHCIAFSSPEGKVIFREALLAGHMEAYFALAAQLCTQAEPAYCGLATLVMILNALEMDPGRVWKGHWRWYHETMLTCCVDPDVLTEGIVMDKFAEVARCNGLNVEIHRVYATSSFSAFRDLVIRMTSSDHVGFLVSSYDRGAMGQTGSGHFAAVGGYHPQRELVFLFDTARFKYPPHWVPLGRLWKSMGLMDPATQKPRGYLVLTRATALQTKPEVIKCPSLTDNSQCSHFGATNLMLFDISHNAWQAFMSPASLGDSRSVGYRLRQVSEAWLKWLQTPTSNPPLDDRLIEEATHFILGVCIRYSPGSFFLTILPVSEMSTFTERSENQLLRGLLSSRVGRVVARIVSELPNDVLNALTGDSATFRLAIGRGFGTGSLPTPDVNTHCPFAELKDGGLRLTVLLTCFLIFSTRCACNTSPTQKTTTESATRQQSFLSLINQMELPGIVCSELTSLQIMFCFLLRSALSMDSEAVVNCRRSNLRPFNAK
ncbi:Glutathione gamma-glutamylcysteinyltransferase 1 [Fasciola gigantica]|uniref:glutathione gamma-glutamylcysteinyltransferase n=1 Tax=Fasciola gigantica TaxID=46835 RepID=A0A504Y9E9_FASGI|nr:Glutathione gamma-glutamylcysteinyltransferase 1 [Fasciola gigantica]